MNEQEKEHLRKQCKNYTQAAIDNYFLSACFRGNLELVKFLLLENNKKANINANENLGFRHACSEGHLEIVKFLIRQNNFCEKININNEKSLGFKMACNGNFWDLIGFFIFDEKIEKNKIIKEYFERKPNIKIEKLFEKRDLNEKLKITTKTNNISEKNTKI